MSDVSESGPMVETQEFDGFWWLPSDAVFPEDGVVGIPVEPSKRLVGKLTIVDGKAELALLGNFGHTVLSETETERVYSPVPADVPRIHGFTSSGKPITLESCDVVASSVNLPGIETATYRARFALIGAWFTEGEAITFDELSVRLSELDAWVGVSGLARTMHGAEEDDSGRWVPSAWDLRYEPPAPIELDLGDGATATFDFGYSVSGFDAVSVRAEIAQHVSLYYRWEAESGIEELPKTVGRLRNFFTLAVGKPVTVLSATGYKDDHKSRGGDGASREPIRIFWQMGHNPKPRGSKLHPIQMLFRLPDVEDLGSLLNTWFARQDVFEPVFDLYFAVLYDPSMYSEVRFLLYAQAIETYDFRRRDPYELEPSEHDQRVREIVDSSPERWKTWLYTKLMGSNYRTLDQRLRDVLAECPAVTARIVGRTAEEFDAFVRAVKNTRNYYTHYTPQLEDKAATDLAERHVLTLQLRAIIETMLLRELGFSCDDIDHFLDRVQRYSDIQRFRVTPPGTETE